MKCRKCGKECLESELTNGLCDDCVKKSEKKAAQKKKKSKKPAFLNDNKNIAILILSIILAIVVIAFLAFFISAQINKSQEIDASDYSSYELIDMFQQNGYNIKIYTSGQYTVYVCLENDAEGITIQRIYNKLIGNMMTFDDKSINDEMADLINTSENDTPEKEQQYEAFENWLKKYNITKYQVSNMLDTYYDLHKDEAEDLRAIENELLNSNI